MRITHTSKKFSSENSDYLSDDDHSVSFLKWKTMYGINLLIKAGHRDTFSRAGARQERYGI